MNHNGLDLSRHWMMAFGIGESSPSVRPILMKPELLQSSWYICNSYKVAISVVYLYIYRHYIISHNTYICISIYIYTQCIWRYSNWTLTDGLWRFNDSSLMGTEAKIHCTFTDKSLCHGSLGLDISGEKGAHGAAQRKCTGKRRYSLWFYTFDLYLYNIYIYNLFQHWMTFPWIHTLFLKVRLNLRHSCFNFSSCLVVKRGLQRKLPFTKVLLRQHGIVSPTFCLRKSYVFTQDDNVWCSLGNMIFNPDAWSTWR